MSDSLSQLKDIHLPQDISWWPLAPGYYGLIILSLISALVILYFYCTRRARRLRKLALNQLALLERDYLQHANVCITAAGISILLKQVALMVYPRSSVAALQGDDWAIFLKKTSKKLPIESIKNILLEAPFCVEYHEPIDPLFNVARAWIKQRRRIWLN